MSLAESQEFFALNPDDLSGPAEQDRSGGSMWPSLLRLQEEGSRYSKIVDFCQSKKPKTCQCRQIWPFHP